MRVIEYDNGVVYSYGSRTPLDFLPEPSAITVGSYDGLHRGHRQIIARMMDVAAARHLRSVMVTFEPHPRLVLKGDVVGPLGLLTTLDEKIELLADTGVDMLVVIRFTPEFSLRSSDDFIRTMLVGLLGAKSIIVGYDHAFGRDRSGSRETLERLGRELDVVVEVVDAVSIDNEHFSSTQIRRLLVSGRIEEANYALGSAYMITGTVVDGEKRGRQIGFPTVNLKLSDPHKLLPRSGVYCAHTAIEGVHCKALMNIGVRPTVSSSGIISLEAHLLGYSGDLYGALLRFTLHRFLREEEQFTTLDALKTQLEKDKKTVELYC